MAADNVLHTRAQALAAYRVLRSGACLRTHSDPPFILSPAHLHNLSLASADLIAAFLSEPAPIPPPPAPQPLSPLTPLERYLLSLPTPAAPIALRLPAPAPASATAKDASLQQIVKDVERDSFLINGAPLLGAAARFEGVLGACCAAASSASGLPSTPALHSAMTSCLQQACRTASGGDAYEAAARHLGLPPPPHLGSAALPLLLTADSTCKAAPVALTFSRSTPRHPHAQPAPALDALRRLAPALPSCDPAQQSELEAAVEWACGLQQGVDADICASTAYLLVLDAASGASGSGSGSGSEPRVLARLQATYRLRLGCCLTGTSAHLFPYGQPTVTLEATRQ